jgi:HAD superfamily hydrolase (TIGR01509 family)
MASRGELVYKRPSTKRLQGVIFDVDGTLVDSNDAHAQAWVEALAESGRHVPFDRVRPLIGMGVDKLLLAAAGVDGHGAEGRTIAARRGDIFRSRYVPELEAFEGARQLLETLRARGLRLAVASSAEAQELKPLLHIAGAEDLIDGKTSRDDAPRSKPDPDIVAMALSRIGCDPDEAVMVGDTPYDVEAARKAGASCIAFRCGGWGDEDLAGAVAVYDGPLDLLDRLEASPLAGEGVSTR